jgi:hypothetical protein
LFSCKWGHEVLAPLGPLGRCGSRQCSGALAQLLDKHCRGLTLAARIGGRQRWRWPNKRSFNYSSSGISVFALSGFGGILADFLEGFWLRWIEVLDLSVLLIFWTNFLETLKSCKCLDYIFPKF